MIHKRGGSAALFPSGGHSRPSRTVMTGAEVFAYAIEWYSVHRRVARPRGGVCGVDVFRPGGFVRQPAQLSASRPINTWAHS